MLHVESVDHILSSCSVIAQTQYKSRHASVARLIHYELAKLGEFPVEDKWWLHDPPSVLENSAMKILWDSTIQTDRRLSHNRPDIVCVNHYQRTAFIIDIARLTQKINEKCERYTDKTGAKNVECEY